MFNNRRVAAEEEMAALKGACGPADEYWRGRRRELKLSVGGGPARQAKIGQAQVPGSRSIRLLCKDKGHLAEECFSRGRSKTRRNQERVSG